MPILAPCERPASELAVVLEVATGCVVLAVASLDEGALLAPVALVLLLLLAVVVFTAVSSKFVEGEQQLL